MARYFFDFRSGDTASTDEEGVVVMDIEAAHHIALGALADGIRDLAIEITNDIDFVVEVRDDLGLVFDVSARVRSHIRRTQ